MLFACRAQLHTRHRKFRTQIATALLVDALESRLCSIVNSHAVAPPAVAAAAALAWCYRCEAPLPAARDPNYRPRRPGAVERP
jgi:hypothetical protein